MDPLFFSNTIDEMIYQTVGKKLAEIEKMIDDLNELKKVWPNIFFERYLGLVNPIGCVIFFSQTERESVRFEESQVDYWLSSLQIRVWPRRHFPIKEPLVIS